MYNDLFSIGPIHVHTYGVMTAIGIIAAYIVLVRLTKKRGLNPDRVFGLLIFCLIFGYLGSKILYLITKIPMIVKDPSLFRYFLADGWVIYGGLLGGILGGWIYCRWRKLPALKYYDAGLTAVALAQGFGRLGCFFAGCCYGEETTSSFCTVFRHSDYAPNNVRLVPTQLLSSAGDFLLFIFLLIFHKKWQKKSGQTASLYLILYSLGRFIIEFFRGDLERGAVGPLSTSQFIGLFTLAAGIIMMILCTRRQEPAAAEAAGEKDEEAAAGEEKPEEASGKETAAAADGEETDGAEAAEETEAAEADPADSTDAVDELPDGGTEAPADDVTDPAESAGADTEEHAEAEETAPADGPAGESPETPQDTQEKEDEQGAGDEEQ